MWFIISLAYIGYIFYWIFKRDVPGYLHKFFYSSRRIKADPTGPYLLIVNAPVIAFLFVAWFIVLDLFFDNQGHWIFLSLVFGLVSALAVAQLLNWKYAYYATTVKDQEDKQRIKQAYDVKDWATKNDVAKVIPNIQNNGAPVGIHIGEGLHWYDKGHMLTVGGSGQGKGVNLILPAILSDSFVNGQNISLVCLDPKGENAAIAAPFLHNAGYEVHILNPFSIPELSDFPTDTWNPFDLIDSQGIEASKLYDVLAMSLHNRKGQGDSSFFDNRCRQYISLYLSYAHHIGQADFRTIAKWLRMSGDTRKQLLASMATDETFEGADTAQAISDRLTGEAAKTEESIYATVEEAIHILKDKALQESLLQSTFDMRQIASKPMAIFICVPFEELGYYAPWIRMFFNFLLRTLTRYYNPNRKVLVLLDEFPQLSYMDEVVRSAAVLRGYNVTLWTVIQDLGQLKRIYGDAWETFISNSVVKHWLSTGTDNTTAEYISKRMPQALKFIGSNPDGSPKERETRLLEPNQVMGFKDIICEVSGMATPARFKKIPYWQLPFAKNNAAPNPFY